MREQSATRLQSIQRGRHARRSKASGRDQCGRAWVASRRALSAAHGRVKANKRRGKRLQCESNQRRDCSQSSVVDSRRKAKRAAEISAQSMRQHHGCRAFSAAQGRVKAKREVEVERRVAAMAAAFAAPVDFDDQASQRAARICQISEICARPLRA